MLSGFVSGTEIRNVGAKSTIVRAGTSLISLCAYSTTSSKTYIPITIPVKWGWSEPICTILCDGIRLRVSPVQPIMVCVAQGWKAIPAEGIVSGDIVKTSTGSSTVKQATLDRVSAPIFHLEVPSPVYVYVAGIMVLLR